MEFQFLTIEEQKSFEWIYQHLPVNLETVAKEEAEAIRKAKLEEDEYYFDDEEDFSSEKMEILNQLRRNK